MKPNEVDEFFGNLPSEDKQVANVFDENKPTEKATEQVPQVESELKPEDGEERKNRRHRRLEEALQRERESNIALNERIKVLAEVGDIGYSKGTQNDVDPDLVRVFGDTDTGKEVARILKNKIDTATQTAEERALQRFKDEQAQTIQEQKQFESFIDSKLETLEDTYNIDLTSDAPAARKSRRELLELVERLSPKDENGSVKDFADFDSAFDILQKTRTQPTSETVNRQKEIAARSMQKSAPGGSESADADAYERWLNQNGIRTRN